jgi:hypothetical protein
MKRRHTRAAPRGARRVEASIVTIRSNQIDLGGVHHRRVDVARCLFLEPERLGPMFDAIALATHLGHHVDIESVIDTVGGRVMIIGVQAYTFIKEQK